MGYSTKLAFRQLKLNATDFLEDVSDGSIKINNNAITTAKIAAAQVTSSKLAQNAVETDKIKAGAVTNDKIAATTIQEGKIGDDQITSDKIAALNVLTAHLANSAVTNAKLADDSVSVGKMAAVAAADYDKLLIAHASTGAVSLGLLEDRHFDNTVAYTRITGLGEQSQILDMGGNQITGVALVPSNDSDAASKQYVDNQNLGLSWKEPAVGAAQGQQPLSGLGASITVDTNAQINDGDRVLLMNQSTPAEDGIYVFTTESSGGANDGSLALADDFNSAAEQSAAALFVLKGTASGDKAYVNTDDTGGNPTFVQFSGVSQYTAGAGVNIAADGEISIGANEVVADMVYSVRNECSSGIAATSDVALSGSGMDIGNFDSGMNGAAAQLFLNGILLRPASSAADVVGAGGASADDGDYDISEDGGSKAILKIADALVAVDDKIELRYIKS